MAQSLYADAGSSSATYFVDKTPRYHLILDELRVAFPTAKFVVLWRNPLDTLASIYQLNRHWNFYRYEIDLHDGWTAIMRFQRLNPEVPVVRYEDLVRSPAETINRIWTYLDLPSVNPNLAAAPLLPGRMGDEKRGSLDYAAISQESLGRWPDVLATRSTQRYAAKYLKFWAR